ncbi:acyltransferase [Segetibacter sp. 3557_3]|uniref:acyltransferase family protein n=1 Tax=Segetibacter sp. 3557_3 TaxID=2547429 RepID=UPI001058DA11|nr:acyltransferase [Segetibacter sp. 3557_3]TDH23305.1 acyltransferase [Segetibacter sp. 3557_3]
MYPRIAQESKRVNPHPPAVRFKELDTLRGVAALYVMLFHLSRIAGYDIDFLNTGVTGVDLFFIISGYVIFMSLEKTRKSRDFIISRLSRLLPSYLVMMAITIVTILLFASSQTPSLTTVLFNTTMLQPWFSVPYIDESYWTLTVELLFYVSMLVLFRIRKLDHIIKIGSIVIAFLFIYYYVTSRYLPESRWFIVPRHLFPISSHFQLFFAGIIFYKLKFVSNQWHSHLLLAICFLLTLFFFDMSGRAHFFIEFETYAFAVLVYFIVFYLFVFNKLSFLNIRMLVFFGSISYGIYLLHQEFAIVLYPYFVNTLGLNPIMAIGLLSALIIGIATFVTYKIELPVIKIIRHKYIGFSPR